MSGATYSSIKHTNYLEIIQEKKIQELFTENYKTF